jgi:hypothetical protein
MFGVGFYSVFSLTEEPIITSGHKYTVFTWNGNQLTTFANELTKGQQSSATAKETSMLCYLLGCAVLCCAVC